MSNRAPASLRTDGLRALARLIAEQIARGSDSEKSLPATQPKAEHAIGGAKGRDLIRARQSEGGPTTAK
jgi:hypothetical protein